MFVVEGNNCIKCKMLKQLLGTQIFNVEFKKAEDNMDLCRELGIQSVPALVIDKDNIVFDIEEIVDIITKQVGGNE